MIRLVVALWVALFGLIGRPALSQVTAASPQVTARVATLRALLGGKADPAAFTPAFIDQIPLSRVTAITDDLRANNGVVTGIEQVEAEGANGATVRVGYDRAVVTVRFAVEPLAPHRFIGLLIANVARRGDSAAKIIADLHALPGRASLIVARLDDGTAKDIVADNADLPLATGSQFKLFVLAELSRQIAAGERRWSDVVPLGSPSLPSGVTQTWPAGAPVTLSTLATQMISISDNTAADTLLEVLGRDRVDAARASVSNTAGALPVLSTREAFTLKMARSGDLRSRWEHGSLSERRVLLHANKWPLASIDLAELVGAPLHIDTVEWPATGREIVAVLDRLRRADAYTRDILAIAPGLPPGERTRFAYAGFKGGSESGVIALAWLLQTRDGRWFAVAGAWNDAAAPVDTARFTALLGRAVALVADGA